MLSRTLTQVTIILCIALFTTTDAFSNNNQNWNKFNINEVYSPNIAEMMYKHCAQSIKDYSEEDVGFYQTACYAHIVGALRMRDMMLGVIGELQHDSQCLGYVSGSIHKWCKISDAKDGHTIYSLAKYYVIANEELNEQHDSNTQYRYGTFSDFLLSNEYCKHGFDNKKLK